MSKSVPSDKPVGFSVTPRPTGISGVPTHLLSTNSPQLTHSRLFSSTTRRRGGERPAEDEDDRPIPPQRENPPEVDGPPGPRLTHLSPAGSARMVSISSKTPTSRVARAVCTVTFSSPLALRLVRSGQAKKGDVLGAARIAGIMAAKRTPDIIPLCHPILLSHVAVELAPASSRDDETALGVEATVTCDGKTGVEMEAMTATAAAALTVYDMCKAVDKGIVIGGLRVVLKDGGKSGRWEMP